LSHSCSSELISREEIRAIYARGEEAVIELVEGLVEKVGKLEERVNALEGKDKKNSRNSSKPPSGDGFGKKTKSLRTKSQRKTGGQIDHPGSTLEWSEFVDVVVEHKVEQCHGCGASIAQEPVQKVWSRQVHDIPPIDLTVYEHRAEVKNCPHCGIENEAEFPLEATNVVQYGPRLKSMMVYLMEGQLLPSARTCEVLSDIVGVNVSEGTLFNTRSQCFEQLAPIASTIQSAIVDSQVVHFDETGMLILLGSIKAIVDEASLTQTPLAADVLQVFETRYQTILDQGFTANPPPPAPPPTKHRSKGGGRQKQSPARNLLDRLQNQQASVLGFMYDFNVPFDNNQAERDIRMVKLKQKISGTFRSESGAQMFCRIRSYISTLRKQGFNVLDAFIALFSGNPQSPIPQPK
jgi:transposase